MLEKPIERISDIPAVLTTLQTKYKLIVATKGDLVDQERKLEKSGLEHHFHHTEILSEKKKADYAKLFNRLDIKAEEFLMIGNSLKSDILPILELGGYAFHIPFHTTWEHEQVDITINHPKFREFARIREVLDYL